MVRRKHHEVKRAAVWLAHQALVRVLVAQDIETLQILVHQRLPKFPYRHVAALRVECSPTLRTGHHLVKLVLPDHLRGVVRKESDYSCVGGKEDELLDLVKALGLVPRNLRNGRPIKFAALWVKKSKCGVSPRELPQHI